MRRTRTVIVALGLVVASCNGGGGGNTASPYPDCPMPEGGNFSGRWNTNLGDMTLTQDGTTVVGSWKDLPNHKSGNIEGTVRGCLLFFSWTQTDDTIPGRPRQTNGRGVFRYVVDPPVGTGLPIHRFEGTWGYDNDVQGGGVWTGRKRREGGA
ncbi:MAG: hypothetical protein GYA57_13500 [Myxococcales bacterium]|nr:hypothetical protein [Myxococcales bacterium]